MAYLAVILYEQVARGTCTPAVGTVIGQLEHVTPENSGRNKMTTREYARPSGGLPPQERSMIGHPVVCSHSKGV